MLYQIDSFYYNFRSQVLLLFPGRLYVWKCMSHKTNPFLYFSTLCSNLKRLVHMLLVHQNPVWFEETLRCPIYILLILLFFSMLTVWCIASSELMTHHQTSNVPPGYAWLFSIDDKNCPVFCSLSPESWINCINNNTYSTLNITSTKNSSAMCPTTLVQYRYVILVL